MSDRHFKSGRSGYPRTRKGVEALSDEKLWAFAGECSVDPGEPDKCMACYAYHVGNDREEAKRPDPVLWIGWAKPRTDRGQPRLSDGPMDGWVHVEIRRMP